MAIIVPKRIIQYPKVRGKIQAWLVDNNSGIAKTIHIKDYLSYKKNLTPNQYLYDLASLGVGDTPDMELKYVGLSTAYDPPERTSTLVMEKARNVPTSVTRVNNKLIVEAKFESDVFTLFPNITGVTSTTVFTVDDATGLAVGQRIAVQLPGVARPEQRKITNISTNTITVHFPFSVAPEIGTDNCMQMFSRLHLVYGASATSSLNSGSGASIAQILTTKLSTQTIYTRHEIEYLAG